jgi:hypothetical protein
MATPLRKDEPQFEKHITTVEDNEITTADLARGQRPASDSRGLRPVLGERNGEETVRRNTEPQSYADMQQASKANEATPLFPTAELDGLRTRWHAIQTGFVDEPRKAVHEADGLVASAMKRLAEVFAQERSGLEQQWDRGDSVSTEDLRVALQRYRAFFERLLAV